MNVDIGEQLALELGDQFARTVVEPRIPIGMSIDLVLVVCQRCTGHHPTERCPQRVVCSLCTGAHHASSHLGEGLMATRKTLHRELQKRRAKMRAEGLSEAAITAAIDAYLAEREARGVDRPPTGLPPLPPGARRDAERREFELLVAEHGLERARQMVYDRQPDQPDDSRYRPRQVDPLLRGPARATGQTAAAVKRRRTFTKWQIDQREASA